MSFISRLKSFFSFILHPVKEDTPVKQYCFDKFRFRYEGQKSMGLNIRAIGLTPETAQKMENSTDKVFFLITEGYMGSFDECEKKALIYYCPCCGTDLPKILR
ncbi:MAG: hypothetical protein JST49_09600 [Bacteroidetes bacterium]|nr:hypothetical protein [Bacteroidota bacterium]